MSTPFAYLRRLPLFK